MNRTAWRAALTVVSLAAIATTGWSLYAVGRHYDAPEGIAGAGVAVYDGIAYACLHLASEASSDGRSAFGARIAAVAMAGASVYLNVFHANLINGGLAAALLFAVPTIALLVVSELAWAGPRAKARAERGERPYRPPVFGGWAWVLAPKTAGGKVRERALVHIEQAGTTGAQQPATPSPYSASEVLRRRFAEMDPADAIRIAHEAQPELPPAELASMLIGYGVIVDAVQVALVLAGRPAEHRVDREEQQGATPVAPQVGGERPALTKSDAIKDVATLLGPDAQASDIASEVATKHRITVEPNFVRTVLSRAKKQAERTAQQPVDPAVGQGGEGYN